jgi:phenylpropionate dioxygenase-like ring-hydroxylating dioxygenase large terminal subunit
MFQGYPFPGLPPYAPDHWYLAAWSPEIGRALTARTILDREMVLFRSRTGDVAALSGVCPHRWAPLGGGQLVEDAVQCPYHGATFDAAGRCVRVPSQERAPPGLALTIYPVVERAPCVWVWPGDPARADPSKVPDAAAFGLAREGWRYDLGRPALVKARAQLLIENLFDQSHLAFVHPQSLRGERPPRQEDGAFVETDDSLSVVHDFPPRPLDPTTRARHPDAGDGAGYRVITQMLGVSLINSVGSQTWDGEAGRGRLLDANNFVHAITPAGPGLTHYFTAVSRNFDLGDDGLSAALSRQNAQVMREDIAVMEAIEARLDAVGDLGREVNFASDLGAMRVRRRMMRILAQAKEEAGLRG